MSAAEEGTMGHHFSEFTLRDRLLVTKKGDWQKYVVRNYLGKKHSGWRLAENHIPGLQSFVDYVWAFVLAGGRLYVENQVDYSEPLGVDKLPEKFRAFGTADALVVMPDGTLWVIDLKFGKWEVDAEGNTQMFLYALGGWRMLRLIHDIKKFRLVIFQPRTKGRPDDQWDATHESLAIFTDNARTAAQRIVKGVNEYETTGKLSPQYYKPSASNCEFCKVEFCEVRKKAWRN